MKEKPYTNQTEKEPLYYIHGRYRNSNAHVSIASTPILGSAIITAKALLHYHLSHGRLSGQDERPFDYFVIADEEENVLMRFTPKHPDGVIMEEQKQEENKNGE